MEIEIGKHIDGWCTRCKLVLRHTIEAIAGGKIKRTHCNTCGGQHPHRTAAPRTRGAGDEQASQAGKYATLLRGRTESVSRAYSTSARFTVGEIISHSTLGLGIVTGERDRTKIDILFPDGQKVLLQGC
jgi:hypothetical protein